MSEEVFCMENQSNLTPKNNIVRFRRLNPSDGYKDYRHIFEEEPLDLTEEEKQAIRAQIAMERALEERS